jgi:hypothetical protein
VIMVEQQFSSSVAIVCNDSVNNSVTRGGSLVRSSSFCVEEENKITAV